MVLGISGISSLASLSLYRPYFMAVAFLALGYAYFITYRGRWRTRRLTGGRGHRPAFHEIILWGVTMLVIGITFLPHYSLWFSQLVEAVVAARGSPR